MKNENSPLPPVINNTAIVSEIYLTVKYLDRIGIKPKWTLKHWWEICRDYFCIIDAHSIDFYWHKYEQYVEYKFTRSYSSTNPRSMGFPDWLQLYYNEKTDWSHVRDQEQWHYINGNLARTRI